MSDERLIAYLLGELPEAESVRLEEQYLADETVFAELRAIEAELYDAYARNSLSPARRRLFEQKLLATPEQRWQLEFSRTLQRVPRTEQRRGRLATVAAVAAVLVLAVVLRWWFATPPPQVTEQPPTTRPQVVIAFELGAGITRDGGKEAVLTIPANADVIRISAKVEQHLPESYGAVLRKPEGTEIWRVDGLRQRSAIVDIPAIRLAAGTYILTLYGPTREEIADYAFRVLKP
jgi:hypothetical protein